MTRTITSLCTAALVGLAGTAQAQDHGHDSAPVSHAAAPRTAPLRFDSHYQHDHYYPAAGSVFARVPDHSVRIYHHGDPYYFQGGVWFRPSGRGYVVVAPPFGIVVPLLPPGYTTVWIAGSSYLYANGAYYIPYGTTGYEVVAPPPGAEPLAADEAGDGAPPADAAMAMPVPSTAPVPPAAPAAPPEPVVYPRNGQSAAQTEADRRACDQWATTQLGAAGDASIFQRAEAACLDGRGYTVR